MERWIDFINRCLMFVAGLCLIVMMFLACANMFLRAVWVPVRGTYEIMGFLGAIVASFALGHTQIKKAHTAVDILVNRFSPRVQGIIDGVSNFACMILFALIAWRTSVWATTLWKTGEVSETLRIIYFPFTYGVAFGAAVLAAVLFVDFIKAFKHVTSITTGPYRLFVDFIRTQRGKR